MSIIPLPNPSFGKSESLELYSELADEQVYSIYSPPSVDYLIY